MEEKLNIAEILKDAPTGNYRWVSFNDDKYQINTNKL